MATVISQQRPGGEKKNPESITLGSTKDGRIELGHLHLAGSDGLGSDVTSGIYLQAYDSLHYMTMDIDGPREGWTLNRCPGPYEILCASKYAGIQGTPEKGNGFFLLAENGDIVIRAPKGRIRMSALDIDLKAEGQDNTRGSINIDSNQSVNVKTPVFDVKAGRSISLFSPGNIDLVANTSMKMVSNFINGLTAASATKPSKTDPTTTTTFNTNSSYKPI